MGNGELTMDEEQQIELPNPFVNHNMTEKEKAENKLIVKVKDTAGMNEKEMNAEKNKLIDAVFGKLIDEENLAEMSKRVILACTNEKVLAINNQVLKRLREKSKKFTMKTFYSVDKADIKEPKAYIEYPDEFLHSHNEAGLPPHDLQICKGLPIMLVRNLNAAAGMSNGTRMIVENIYKNLLECRLITGEQAGDIVYVPRITLTSKDLPFELSRKQFPVKPCFAMTINKSQGQTIDFVGIDLTDPVFSHGMAYVAFSRARAWEFIRVAITEEKKNKIRNIVWKEVLLDENITIDEEFEDEQFNEDDFDQVN